MFKKHKIKLKKKNHSFCSGGASSQIWTSKAGSFTSLSFWIAAWKGKAYISAWE